MNIAEAWQRIEAAAAAVGKSLHLRKGAKEADIVKAEKVFGRRLPPEFRESVALHDGSSGAPLDTGEGEVFPWLPGCNPLRSLAEITGQWKAEREWDDEGGDGLEPADEGGRINRVVKHPARIPIAGNQFWDGDNSYLDFVPAANGVEGQVVSFSTECDLEWMGASFGDALRAYVRALESGAWVWKGTDVSPKDDDSFDNRATQFAEWLVAEAGGTTASPPAKAAKAAKPAVKAAEKSTEPAAKTTTKAAKPKAVKPAAKALKAKKPVVKAKKPAAESKATKATAKAKTAKTAAKPKPKQKPAKAKSKKR